MAELPARFLRNSISNYVNTGSMALFTVLMTPLLARSLGAEQYGIWAFAGSFVLVGLGSVGECRGHPGALRDVDKKCASGEDLLHLEQRDELSNVVVVFRQDTGVVFATYEPAGPIPAEAPRQSRQRQKIQKINV